MKRTSFAEPKTLTITTPGVMIARRMRALVSIRVGVKGSRIDPKRANGVIGMVTPPLLRYSIYGDCPLATLRRRLRVSNPLAVCWHTVKIIAASDAR